jgi:ubiquinone/menaquinone biosynthesis C-methylase UbiE
MDLTDKEFIDRFNLKPSDRVLDVGGSMNQHKIIKIDTLVDLIRPEDAPYGPSKLLAKNFIKADITKERLPFENKEFDFVFCSQTLEDLSYPFLIIDEMSRVAKRGLLIFPCMGADMVFSKIDFTDWLTGARRVPGHAHHKWFLVTERGKLKVIPKNYPILYSSDFQVVRWLGEKDSSYYWEGKIEYEEFIALNMHRLIDEYADYLRKNRKIVKVGKALFFVDSPFNLVKAWTKRCLRRGEGYKYRRT